MTIGSSLGQLPDDSRTDGVIVRGYHLSGRVTDVAFRGRGYEHAIDISAGTRLTGVFADARAARGETVGLRLDPAGCHVFPAEP